jgi:Zn-dependent M28 family amino/carboxypeptidase
MNLRRSLLFIVFGLSFFVLRAQSFPDSLIHPELLRSRMEMLAHDSMNGRFAGSVELEKAAALIVSEFKKAGLKPIAGLDGFFMPVPGLGNNIMGGIQGKTKPGEIIIISAHYDHMGTRRTNPFPFFNDNADKSDTIYNGANDNASGVVALMSLAAYYVSLGNNARTILFIAFTGEEGGLRGSRYLTNEMGLDSIVAVINIEMIGRRNKHSSTPYITGDEQSNFREILNDALRTNNKKRYGNRYFTKDLYPEQGLFRRSDNYPFVEKGIVAHTIMLSAPTDTYYHSADDESSTLDYRLMSNIIKAIAISCRTLVNGNATPKFINTH